MTDRPIIMSAPMVRALLAGRKTQTRRIIKLPTKAGLGLPIYEHPRMGGWAPTTSGGGGCFTIGRDGQRVPAPERVAIWHQTCGNCLEISYQLGDRLWVREAWADVNSQTGPALSYRSGGMRFCCEDAFPVEYERYPGCLFSMWCGDLWRGEPGHVWRSPIHMPRWASRLTLTVTDVRVQRLQDISEEDAKAEGLACLSKDGGRTWKFGIADRDGWPGNDDFGWHWHEWEVDPRRAYARLWDNLHGADAWAVNPWVAALTFTVTHANIDAQTIGAAP